MDNTEKVHTVRTAAKIDCTETENFCTGVGQAANVERGERRHSCANQQRKEKYMANKKVSEKADFVTYDGTSNVLREIMVLGDVFIKSQMFKDVKDQAQAVVKILAGKELGLSPLESMTNVYIVNGKITMQAKIIASLIKKSKKYDYKIVKLTNEECILKFFQEEQDVGDSTFSMQDAAKAGIINKDVWKNYPRNMLFARALSNGARWYCSDVYCGYTSEELTGINEIETQKVVVINNDNVNIVEKGESNAKEEVKI